MWCAEWCERGRSWGQNKKIIVKLNDASQQECGVLSGEKHYLKTLLRDH